MAIARACSADGRNEGSSFSVLAPPRRGLCRASDVLEELELRLARAVLAAVTTMGSLERVTRPILSRPAPAPSLLVVSCPERPLAAAGKPSSCAGACRNPGRAECS